MAIRTMQNLSPHTFYTADIGALVALLVSGFGTVLGAVSPIITIIAGLLASIVYGFQVYDRLFPKKKN